MEMPAMPSFWLKVRKEYIFDNFNELIEYLKVCPYDPLSPTADFDNTLDCMMELIADWRTKLTETPLYATPDTGTQTPETMIRLMGAALLAWQKKGHTPCELIMTLIDTLLSFNTKLADMIWKPLWDLSLACARGCSVKKYSFTWNDIATGGFTISGFAYRLSQTSYASSGDSTYVENSGLMIIDKDHGLRLAPMTLGEYSLKPTNALFDIESLLSVRSSGNVKKLTDFESTEVAGRHLLAALDSVKTSAASVKTDYTAEDTIPVKIIRKSGIKMTAVTIDPRYNRIEGTIQLTNQPFRPDSYRILSGLREGDTVLVNLATEGVHTFDMTHEMETTYRNLGHYYARKRDYAVFTHRGNGVVSLITAHGLRVMIHNSKLNKMDEKELDEYMELLESRTPVLIEFYDRAHDDGDSFKIYAQPGRDEDYDDDLRIFTETDADDAFVKELTADAAEFIEGLPAVPDELTRAPEFTPRLVAHLLFNVVRDSDLAPLGRLQYALAAGIAARMAVDHASLEYIMHQINVLSRFVAFCHNKEVKPLTVADSLAGIPAVADDVRLVKILEGYKPYVRGGTAHALTDMAADPAERIDKLVESSNNLRDIIGESELNNIKLAIARTLKAEEEYEPVVDNRTFYGIESISLELKKSIVFPPKNRRRFVNDDADPELQKWAILKPICGFLNSRMGGELLLGVNDEGFADGVDADIERLAQRREIACPDIDHYRLYVQGKIDFAFREYGANTASTDITSLNISYIAEVNPEGKQILRIKVTPYPYGAVAFAEGLTRPEGYHESYVRKDGMTRELTPALRADVEKYKLDGTATESRKIILLSKAAETRNIVVLKNYTSGSGVADREVEVYKVWKNRGLLLGYDFAKRDVRVFKAKRAETIEVTDRRWTSPKGRTDITIDPFGMLLDERDCQGVELHLTDYGRLLLLEAVPAAELTAIRKPTDDKCWRFTCRVSSMAGIGRFCLGLPSEVTVAQGEKLKEYLHDGATQLLDA